MNQDCTTDTAKSATTDSSFEPGACSNEFSEGCVDPNDAKKEANEKV